MPQLTGRSLSESLGRKGATLIIVGGWGLVSMWYLAGALGQPRRYPITLPWLGSISRVGAAFAVIVAIGWLMILYDFARTMLREPAQWFGRRLLRAAAQAGSGGGS